MIKENWNSPDYIEEPDKTEPFHPPENRAGILPDKRTVGMRASFTTVLVVFGVAFLAGVLIGVLFL